MSTLPRKKNLSDTIGGSSLQKASYPAPTLQHPQFRSGLSCTFELLPELYSCSPGSVALRISGTLGDIDPLKKVRFQRARSRIKNGPL